MSDETAIALRPVNPELLIAQAIDKGVSVDTMERLLAMRRELKAEAAKEAFDRALAAFQADCPTIQKTKAVTINGSVRYRYAPLEDVVSQVKALLQQHGFSYTLNAQVETGWVTATCELTHSFGHSKQSSFKVPIEAGAKMGEAQKFASALTFAKRYSFVNSLGIMTSDEDDDSQASQENHPHVSTPHPTPKDTPKAKPAQKQATPAKTADLDALLKASKTKFIANLTAEKKLFDGWVYLVENGVILETEVIEDARVEKLFPAATDGGEDVESFKKNLVKDYEVMMSDIRAHTILDEDFAKWNGLFEAAYNEQKKPKTAKPIEVPRDPQTTNEDDWWRAIIVPFGQHEGTTLGELPKNTLFGFWANYEPREYKGRIKDSDKTFREALDDAGEHYEFKTPE